MSGIFHVREMRMRTLILALTAATILAVTAFTAGAVLVGSPDPTQKYQVRSGGLGGPPHGGFLRGEAYDRLAKGDMMGDGGGAKMGGMMGEMKGTMGKKGG
jgi:hypothetical protein